MSQGWYCAKWRRKCLGIMVLLAAAAMLPQAVHADIANGELASFDHRIDIDDYVQVQGFALPTPVGPADVLSDGRLVMLSDTTVLRETAPGSRNFVALGTLPDADISAFGASFLSISPDDRRIAVGNNGGASFTNFEVGIFTLSSLSGTWFKANSFLGEWINNRFVALTAGTFGAPSVVTVLDRFSPDPANPLNRTIIQNIGGASGGIAFDKAKNLYTGNGFAITGPSTTGTVKAFRILDWLPALLGGSALDFETDGTVIVTVLSAAPLGFDRGDNLFVGGGDFGGSAGINFAAMISARAVRSALRGNGSVDVNDPDELRKVDPDPAPSSFYSVIINEARDEVYLNSSGATVFVFRAN
jgi:hypothetical protein